jgi:competence ComEA-like helix-hairpin-helix protein
MFLTREQERGLVLLLAASLLVGGALLLRPARGPGPTPAPRPITLYDVAVIVPRWVEPKRIDINHASAVELTELPGIGPALAARIVAYRAERGPFRAVDDLVAVKGIGPATVEGLRELAVVGEAVQTGSAPL